MVIVKWDILEPVSEEITEGTEITVTGVVSGDDGNVELVLTDLTNLEIK